MQIDFTPDEQAFQLEVRQWLEANKPDNIGGSMGSLSAGKDEILSWEKKLASKGWLAVGWPKEYGGPGWTATQRYIWDEECARAGAPGHSVFGIQMCGHVIMAFGNDEQKAEHLPRIANGEVIWCQGYSEPGSGSDLASLKTKAELDGDDYIVNGQKIWTTGAHKADWMFALVRTEQSQRKQDGISFLLIDMSSPGIEVRPIVSIDGEHHLNEVFLTDVRVPAKNLVGEPGKGWTAAKYLLGFERTGIAGVPGIKRWIADLKALAQDDPGLRNDPVVSARMSRRIADLEVDALALEYTNLRALERAEKGQSPGPESSGLKIKGTELQQALSEIRVELGGPSSLPWLADPIGDDAYDGATSIYNILRASTIYGGSNEIQRNVLSKMALGF